MVEVSPRLLNEKLFACLFVLFVIMFPHSKFLKMGFLHQLTQGNKKMESMQDVGVVQWSNLIYWIVPKLCKNEASIFKCKHLLYVRSLLCYFVGIVLNCYMCVGTKAHHWSCNGSIVDVSWACHPKHRKPAATGNGSPIFLEM
jgi:hypothetical protein